MPLKNKEFGFHGSFKPEGNTPHQIQRGKAANALRPHIEKHLKHALEIYTQKLEGTKLGKHYASLKVDSNMVDHFLDSKHGRALASADQEDNFNFHDQLRKSAGEFMSHYKPELHEEAIGDFLDTHHTKAAPYAKKLNKEQLLAAHRMTKSPEHKKIASDEMKSRGISEETILEYEKYTDENGVTWNDEGGSDKGHTNWGRGPRLKSSQYGPTIKSKFGNHKVRLNKSTGKWEKVQEEVEAEESISEQTSASGDRTITNSHTDKAAAVAIREQLEQAGYDASVVKAGPVYKVVVEGMGRAATLKLIEEQSSSTIANSGMLSITKKKNGVYVYYRGSMSTRESDVKREFETINGPGSFSKFMKLSKFVPNKRSSSGFDDSLDYSWGRMMPVTDWEKNFSPDQEAGNRAMHDKIKAVVAQTSDLMSMKGKEEHRRMREEFELEEASRPKLTGAELYDYVMRIADEMSSMHDDMVKLYQRVKSQASGEQALGAAIHDAADEVHSAISKIRRAAMKSSGNTSISR